MCVHARLCVSDDVMFITIFAGDVRLKLEGETENIGVSPSMHAEQGRVHHYLYYFTSIKCSIVVCSRGQCLRCSRGSRVGQGCAARVGWALVQRR